MEKRFMKIKYNMKKLLSGHLSFLPFYPLIYLWLMLIWATFGVPLIIERKINI